MVSQKKTVCMLIYNYYPSSTGGAEKQCRLQAHELVRTGDKCIILTARVNSGLRSKESDFGCDVVRVPVVQPLVDLILTLKNGKSAHLEIPTELTKKTQIDKKASEQSDFFAMSVQWLNILTFMIGAFFYLCRHRKQIDLIHTHVASWNAGFTCWVGKLLKIPTLCKAAYLPAFHDFSDFIPFAKKWRKWRVKISYIALLPEMAENLYEQGVPKNKIHIIPNGVSVPDSLSIVSDNSSVLYVGNFTQGSAHKGFDVLLKAWSIVCREIPDAHLLIAGSGDKTPWAQMAKGLGCYENIEFLGHVHDMESLYKRAALFVLPSRGEGISNALLEAQSYGIPCVVTDIPGNREVVVDQKTGFIVPINDDKQFSDAIVNLITNKDVRGSMGTAARENINKKFSIEKVVEQVKKIYFLV